jgi:LacI family transcriptional regulator
MKVTSTQVARRLGISRSTVSRALSGYPHVDAELRKRVLATAAEMGYRPNHAAQSLAKGETLLIGFVVYSKPEKYWERVLRGVKIASDMLHDYGVVIETVITDISKPQAQDEAMRALVEKGAQAIVLSPSAPNAVAGTIDEMMGRGIPIVLLNTDVPQSSRLCCVGSDYIQAGRLAGELLCRFLMGRGKIASIVFDDSGTMTPQKLTGFREEIGRFAHVEMLGPYLFSRTGEDVYDRACQLLKTARPDAIFMTYGQVEDVARAIEDTGFAGRVPLVGYDATEDSLELLRRRVVSALISQEPEQQAILCVRILHDYLARDIRPKSSIIHARLDVITSQNSMYYHKDAMSASNYYYI